MKRIAVSFLITVFTLLLINNNSMAQNKNDFADLWKNVEALESKGKPRSAIDQVNEIYRFASSEKNNPQIAKAIIYRLKLMSSFEEDAAIKGIQYIDKEIQMAGSPLKEILLSLKAELLWDYYEDNRYVILERSNTAILNENADFTDWSYNDFAFHVNACYGQSLKNTDTKDMSIELWDAILLKGEDRNLRPTLYDFLAFRAIDHYSNAESFLNKSKDDFSVNDVSFFSPWSEFIKLEIPENNKNASWYYIRILQDLMQFHAGDKDLSAFIDADLARLKYVYDNSTHTDRDSLYVTRLMDWFEGNNMPDIVAEAGYRVAMLKSNLPDKDNQCNLCESVKICNRIIDLFPKTSSAKAAKNHITNIQSPSLSITTQEAVASNREALMLVRVKNAEKLYFRIVELDYNEHPAYLARGYNSEDRIKKWLNKKPAKAWSESFSLPADYRDHSFETAVPALPYGYYAILASNDENFSVDAIRIYTAFQVSDLVLVNQRVGESQHFMVNDRSAGKPVADAKVSIYKSGYREGISLINEYKTDAAGICKPNKIQMFFGGFYIIENENDKLIVDKYLHRSTPGGTSSRPRAWIFTDRAVYRPGQTLSFNILLTKNENDDVAVVSGQNMLAELRDMNYQIRSELNMNTSEYGTANGSFIIPNDIPTGTITINTPYGSHYVRVEEYKRPAFEILMDEVEARVNATDSIKVSGSVKTYSGVPVADAEIAYRITRSSYSPWRWWWYPVTDDEKEIAYGSLNSDSDGGFSVSFEPSPAEKSRNFFGYVYRCTIIATDLAGETHETTITVTDAVKKIAVKTTVPNTVLPENNNDIPIEIVNHLEETVPCEGVVYVEKLQLPEKVYRERLWDAEPDIFLLNEIDFSTRFPFDYYKKPNEYNTLPVEDEVLKKNFSAGKSTLSTDELSGLENGVYRLRVNAVSGNDTAMLSKEFVVVANHGKTAPEKRMFSVYYNDKDYEPGENAAIWLSSASENLSVHYILSDGMKILDEKNITLNNETLPVSIAVKETYRGGVYAVFYATLNGRFFSKKIAVDVPYTNKELNIEYITFRDVIQPGSDEVWTMKFTDYKGNPVNAEVMATLYDRSLDAIAPLEYNFSPFRKNPSHITVEGYLYDLDSDYSLLRYAHFNDSPEERFYDELFWSPTYYGARGRVMYMSENVAYDKAMPVAKEEMVMKMSVPDEIVEEGGMDEKPEKAPDLRVDFRETGFFFPDIHTNEDGVATLSFTAPQSVTGWKFTGLAHTKELAHMVFEKDLVTRKNLMITPNMPRFVRQGDQLVLQARITNLLDEGMSVETWLELFDPVTGVAVENIVKGFNRKVLQVTGNGTAMAEWTIDIPMETSSLGIRSYARSGLHTDGEEHVIPVLPSEAFVVESFPLSIDGAGTYEFSFDNLKKKSRKVRNHALTLEYTANPAWYAVQALPYLDEVKSNNAAALFSRYYANAVASYIANYYPEIKRVFDLWRGQSPEALLSALEKNQDLKTTLLQESPWLAEARDETEQKRRIALLFDLNRIARTKTESWNMLKKMQYPDGSWPWFEGMRPSLFTTLSVVESSARLFYLGVENNVPNEILRAAGYLDNEAQKEYERAISREGFDPEKPHISSFAISWLYARSLLGDNMPAVSDQPWFAFYMKQIKDHWTGFGLYQQSLAAIILWLNVEPDLSAEIIESLTERAMFSDDLGMYWKELHASPYWYEAPIETMASLIEAYTLVSENDAYVRQMKKWLLTQKQTNKWESSIGTVHAIYALLLQGENVLSGEEGITIRLDDTVVVDKEDQKEAGTGYIRKSWHGKEIRPEMGNISVTSEEDRFSWGALHWQYYVPYREVESAANGLTINRTLYKQIQTEQGPLLEEIADVEKIANGDKIIVRMEVVADRDYSFVHLKDQRTAAYEPVDTRSGYQYKNGAGYYLSVRDASVNYYFDHLPKGSYVFEYELYKIRKGTYSGGMSTIQCMYAPEFNAHSCGE